MVLEINYHRFSPKQYAIENHGEKNGRVFYYFYRNQEDLYQLGERMPVILHILTTNASLIESDPTLGGFVIFF